MVSELQCKLYKMQHFSHKMLHENYYTDHKGKRKDVTRSIIYRKWDLLKGCSQLWNPDTGPS